MPFRMRADGGIAVARAAGIYPAMQRDLEAAGARFLLLLGDQIYSDALPPLSARAALVPGQESLPSSEAAPARYRRVYRAFFAEPGFRALRERFPTYWMWDGHDIFNDWGSLLHETPRDRALFSAAARAYREYQHAPQGRGGRR